MKLKHITEILQENPGHVFNTSGDLIISSDFDTRLIIASSWLHLLDGKSDLPTKLQGTDLRHFTKAPPPKKKALAFEFSRESSAWAGGGIFYSREGHPRTAELLNDPQMKRAPEFDIDPKDLP